MIFVRPDASGSPGKHPTKLGELDVHLELFSFPRWRTTGSGGSSRSRHCASIGNKSHVVRGVTAFPSMRSFSVSVVQRGASASPLCSGISTMVSCLWMDASWSSCEGNWSWEQLTQPSWKHHFEIGLNLNTNLYLNPPNYSILFNVISQLYPNFSREKHYSLGLY